MSHTLDAILLLGVAIITFGIITLNLLPLPLPPSSPHTEFSVYIRGNYLFIEHMGGDNLKYSKIKLIVKIGNERQHKPPLIEIYKDGLWECGEYVCYPYNSSEVVNVMIIDEESNTVLLYGSLKRGVTEWIGTIPPLLVSSLRTNSEDEDLTCYSLSQEGFNAKTFIYNWKKNGTSIYEVLLPFDTQDNSQARDYSGNGYNSVVDGATWTPDGKVGGAYSFDGIDDGIVCPLPSIFKSWQNNFTISFWMWSKDIEVDGSMRCLCEVYRDQNNSIQIFQYNSSLYCAFNVNGTISYIATPPLNNSTWYLISIVWKDGNPAIYVNGTLSSVIPDRVNYQSGNTPSMTIGRRSDRNATFYGCIDEFYVYRYARSPHQIYQDYMDMKDGLTDHRTLVADETAVGETWSCSIIPNDSTKDGDTIESNEIVIISYGGGVT